MKLLYNNSDGEIFYAVYDKDWFAFRHSTNIMLIELEIDEVSPDNKTICADLKRWVGKKDINYLGKYYIDTDELYERDHWEEYVDGYED